MVVRIMHDGQSDIFATGLYLDTYRAAGDELKFAKRLAVCNSSRIDTLMALPLCLLNIWKEGGDEAESETPILGVGIMHDGQSEMFATGALSRHRSRRRQRSEIRYAPVVCDSSRIETLKELPL